MASAAIAWARLQQVSTAHFSSCGGGALLAEAVDAVAAHDLASLLPAQLLGAASAALQARLAQLRTTLSAVDDGLAAATVAEEAGSEDAEVDRQPVLPDEVEALLVEVLRVSYEVQDLKQLCKKQQARWGPARRPRGRRSVQGHAVMLCRCMQGILSACSSTCLCFDMQELCTAVESAAELLSQLCDRALRAQPAMGPGSRTALLSAGQRFRRQAAAAIAGAQGCPDWAGERAVRLRGRVGKRLGCIGCQQQCSQSRQQHFAWARLCHPPPTCGLQACCTGTIGTSCKSSAVRQRRSRRRRRRVAWHQETAPTWMSRPCPRAGPSSCRMLRPLRAGWAWR